VIWVNSIVSSTRIYHKNGWALQVKVDDNDYEIDHEVRLHEQENSVDRWHYE
jgi:hypothetical protein